MDHNQVLTEVNSIFKNVLDDDTIILTDTTTANDVEEWDSLNNIQLVVAIEKHFKLKFTTSEIQSWKNVGEMCRAILQKKVQ